MKVPTWQRDHLTKLLDEAYRASVVAERMAKRLQRDRLTSAIKRDIDETFRAIDAHSKVVDKLMGRARTQIRRLNTVTGRVVHHA